MLFYRSGSIYSQSMYNGNICSVINDSTAKRNAGNALLAACLVILLMDPSAVYDVGLQLSFLSVASILLFVSQLNPINRHLHPRLHLITSSILVSLVATLSTWVLVSYYFKRIPILFYRQIC